MTQIDYPEETQPELAAALDFIMDSLDEQSITHDLEQIDHNPNAFSVGSIDPSGFFNSGIVGWSEERGLMFYAHDPIRDNHDKMEGVEDSLSRCWWEAKSATVFAMHLSGEVRKIMRRHAERVGPEKKSS